MDYAIETEVGDAAKHLRLLDQALNQILFGQEQIISLKFNK
jgi:hypothetical protein